MANKQTLQQIEAKLVEAKAAYAEFEKLQEAYNAMGDAYQTYVDLVNEALALAADEDITVTTPDGQEIAPGDTYYEENGPWNSSWC